MQACTPSGLRAAQAAGDLAADADLAQHAFEIASHLLHTDRSSIPVGDARVLERARTAVSRLLEAPEAAGRPLTWGVPVGILPVA